MFQEGALSGGGTTGAGRGVEQGVKGQSAGIGRMHGSCQSSCGTWCWQSSARGQCSDPQPQGFGSTASWPASFPAPCMSSTALDLPLLCPVVAVARGAPAGFGTAVLCPLSPPPLSVLCAGQG